MVNRSTRPPFAVTYPRYIVAVHPEMSEPYRTRIIAGRDKIDYDGNVTMHTAPIKTIRMHWNSVILTPGAKYCTANISNMYLCSLLPDSDIIGRYSNKRNTMGLTLFT